MSQNSEPHFSQTGIATKDPLTIGLLTAFGVPVRNPFEEMQTNQQTPASTPAPTTGSTESNPFTGLTASSSPSSNNPDFDQLVDGIINNPTPMEGGDAAAGKTTKAPKAAPLFGGDLHFHISPDSATPSESITTPNSGKESIF